MANLYTLLRDPQYDWRVKLGDDSRGLINMAKDFSPNLFLFDDYHEKSIEENASDQLVYTYTVINLYSLFFDSGRYLSDACSPFQTDIANDDAEYIRCFYDSLQELRSMICHNKPADSLRREKLYRLPEWKNNEWRCFDYLRSSWQEFSYDDSFKLLTRSAIKILDILNGCLISKCDNHKFEKEWYDSIIKWYQKNMTVRIRAVQAYFKLDPAEFKKKFKQRYGYKLVREDQYIDKVEEKLNESWLPNFTSRREWDDLYDKHFRADADDPMSLSPLNAMKKLLDQNL